MKDEYFEKFKETEQKDRSLGKQILPDRLRKKDGTLLFESDVVFTVPITEPTKHNINVGIVGETDPGKYSVYLGTGTCCSGHFYNLQVKETELELVNVVSFDINVYDLAVVGDGKQVMAVGKGCSGSGIRLLDANEGVVKTLVSSQEFEELYRPKYGEDSCICFGFEEKNILLKWKGRGMSGRINEKICDLTSRLREGGVNIHRTIDRNKKFHHIYNW